MTWTKLTMHLLISVHWESDGVNQRNLNGMTLDLLYQKYRQNMIFRLCKSNNNNNQLLLVPYSKETIFYQAAHTLKKLRKKPGSVTQSTRDFRVSPWWHLSFLLQSKCSTFHALASSVHLCEVFPKQYQKLSFPVLSCSYYTVALLPDL